MFDLGMHTSDLEQESQAHLIPNAQSRIPSERLFSTRVATSTAHVNKPDRPILCRQCTLAVNPCSIREAFA
jgi:hypothetical protein